MSKLEKPLPHDGSTLETWQQAKARRETAMADLAELQRDTLSGKLVEYSQIEPVLGQMFDSVKQRPLDIPRRVAPMLVIREQQYIQDRLYHEIEEALRALVANIDLNEEEEETEMRMSSPRDTLTEECYGTNTEVEWWEKVLVMRFYFNQKKAAQAGAYLLKLHGKPMDLIVFMKTLYLADRASLVETGSPITGDCMISMDHGPLLSRIYDYTQWKPIPGNVWFDYISEKANNGLALVSQTPDCDELSEYEMEVLQRTHDQYGSYDPFVLSQMTHNLPEWQDPRGSSLPIDPAEILKAEGKSSHDIEKATQEAEAFYQFHQLVHSGHA